MPRLVANRIHQLDVFPTYKGGRTCVAGGYVHEFQPDHPLANGWGWVAQHRLVGEDIAGRPLRRSKNPRVGECVHHVDECRTNNNPANLVVLTVSAHRHHHTTLMNQKRRADITADMVLQALRGRTIKEAAESLGIVHQTLRNRFPELIADRKRTSPHEIADPANAAALRPYASSDQWSIDDAAKALGCLAIPWCGPVSATACCGSTNTGPVGRRKPASFAKECVRFGLHLPRKLCTALGPRDDLDAVLALRGIEALEASRSFPASSARCLAPGVRLPGVSHQPEAPGSRARRKEGRADSPASPVRPRRAPRRRTRSADARRCEVSAAVEALRSVPRAVDPHRLVKQRREVRVLAPQDERALVAVIGESQKERAFATTRFAAVEQYVGL